MIAQWENECISLSVLPVARVQCPEVVEYFKEFFLADHILPNCPEPKGQKMAQSPLNSITQTVDIEEEGPCPTADRVRKSLK